MNSSLLNITICTVLSITAADASGENTKREWKGKLSSHVYKVGMRRSDVEKRIGAKILAEFTFDHGFGILRDVYYQLDSQWCAVISYSPRVGIDPSTAEKATMSVTVSPHLVANHPGLLDELRKRALSNQPKR